MSALKADVTAAERLLKAAVREARTIVCDGPFGFQAAVETLTVAGTAADLLLRERTP